MPTDPPVSTTRRMAPTDALFWYAEDALPIFRPIIAGLFLLDGPLDAVAVRSAMDRTLTAVPRLRQRVVEMPLHLGLPEWVDDPHFDDRYHLRHVALPAPGTRRRLLDLVASLFATPLDRERPLWEAYWIDGLEDGRSAYLLKLHHSLVDGVGSIAIVNAITHAVGDPTPASRAQPPQPPEAEPEDAFGQLTRVAGENLRAGARLALDVASLPLRVAASPLAVGGRLLRTARGLRGVAEDLTALRIRDPLAVEGSGLSRRLDTLDIPIERLRKIKAPLGVTLNDVVLTVLAGAIGRYHIERKVQADTLNCMVPMSLRRGDESADLGNRVGTFNVVLPVGEADPLRRLEAIVAQTRTAKRDKRGAAAPLLIEALGLVPGAAFAWIARQSLGKVNVACTNVPGSPEPRRLANTGIEALYPFVSVVEGTPLVVALTSYAGTMHVGIDTDPEAIPDTGRISELLAHSLDELEQAASRAGSGAPTG